MKGLDALAAIAIICLTVLGVFLITFNTIEMNYCVKRYDVSKCVKELGK